MKWVRCHSHNRATGEGVGVDQQSWTHRIRTLNSWKYEATVLEALCIWMKGKKSTQYILIFYPTARSENRVIICDPEIQAATTSTVAVPHRSIKLNLSKAPVCVLPLNNLKITWERDQHTPPPNVSMEYSLTTNPRCSSS